MGKIKKLERKIEELERDLFFEKDKSHNLFMSSLSDDSRIKELKAEITCIETKYIDEVQKNVVLADIIVILRQKLDDAERCGYVEQTTRNQD